jgi:AcrR family transcriptional regulator
MPRHVNHDERRVEILRATLEVLAEHGPRGLTVRAVAGRMGGSSTLVTHYFSSRQALLDALAELVADWPGDLAKLETDVEDPRQRLRLFLRWMVPTDEAGYIEERARINLIGEHAAPPRTRNLFETWDNHVRAHFRRHLEGLVAGPRVEPTTDLLRTITNGLTLSAIEHPDRWPPERQFAVIDDALESLGLAPPRAMSRRRTGPRV